MAKKGKGKAAKQQQKSLEKANKKRSVHLDDDEDEQQHLRHDHGDDGAEYEEDQKERGKVVPPASEEPDLFASNNNDGNNKNQEKDEENGDDAAAAADGDEHDKDARNPFQFLQQESSSLDHDGREDRRPEDKLSTQQPGNGADWAEVPVKKSEKRQRGSKKKRGSVYEHAFGYDLGEQAGGDVKGEAGTEKEKNREGRSLFDPEAVTVGDDAEQPKSSPIANPETEDFWAEVPSGKKKWGKKEKGSSKKKRGSHQSDRDGDIVMAEDAGENTGTEEKQDDQTIEPSLFAGKGHPGPDHPFPIAAGGGGVVDEELSTTRAAPGSSPLANNGLASSADHGREASQLIAQIEEEREQHARAMNTQMQEHRNALARQKEELTELFEERRRKDEEMVRELHEANDTLRSELQKWKLPDAKELEQKAVGNLRARHAAEIEGLRGSHAGELSYHRERLHVANSERDRLRMTLNSIGEATDLKGNKEDSY